MNEYNGFTVDQMIGSYYIRYDRLNKIIPAFYKNSTMEHATVIDFIIDISSIIRRIKYTNVKITSEYAMAALIINMCAHYRNYFRYIGVELNIYIVCSRMDNGSINSFNRKYYPDYQFKFNVKSIQPTPDRYNIIDRNLDILNTLCDYLPNIYFVEFNYSVNWESGVAIKDLVSSANATRPAIILTKDRYLYQLITPFCAALTPYKQSNTDGSYILGYDLNTSQIMLEGLKQDTPPALFYPNLFSLFMAMSRVPNRNIRSLFKTNMVLDKLNTLMREGLVDFSTRFISDDLISYIIDLMTEGTKKNKNKLELELSCRVKAIDLTCQATAYKTINMGYIIDKRDLKNLYDPETVKHINNRYFADMPLDLNAL